MEFFGDRRDFMTRGAALGGGAVSGLFWGGAQARSVPQGKVDARDFGVVGDGKKDDTDALRKAVKNSPPGTTIFVPRGHYAISGSIDLAPTQALLGEPFGSKILVNHHDAPAVRVPVECGVKDLVFEYPNNADPVNPQETPETISLIGNGAGYIDNITFINAFIGVGTPKEGANCGQSVIRKLNGFVHDTMVRIDGSLDIVRIENVHCFVATGNDPDNAYYRHKRKCFHILASDGTLISKSFMIRGGIFLLKEPGRTGAGLSTYLSQCWLESMTSYGIQQNDASRLCMMGVELTCGNAKALVELNNGAGARIIGCYFRDSMNSTGIVVNQGSSLILSDSEFFGTPGFTAVRINSAESTLISGNFIHHCEVGIHCAENSDNYIITGNRLSGNNQPTILAGGAKSVVKDNI